MLLKCAFHQLKLQNNILKGQIQKYEKDDIVIQNLFLPLILKKKFFHLKNFQTLNEVFDKHLIQFF
jgi:hypothetical protein